LKLRDQVPPCWEAVGEPKDVWEAVGEPKDVDRDAPGMADLVGLLQDVDIERPPQGAYEKRDPIT
jgi:hypothetical protein